MVKTPNSFYAYLRGTALTQRGWHFTEKSARCYCYYIQRTLVERGLTIASFSQQIASLIHDYSVNGPDAEDGAKSKGSWRNALLKYRDFLED
jgi:hypothetical protein